MVFPFQLHRSGGERDVTVPVGNLPSWTRHPGLIAGLAPPACQRVGAVTEGAEAVGAAVESSGKCGHNIGSVLGASDWNVGGGVLVEEEVVGVPDCRGAHGRGGARQYRVLSQRV